MLGLFRKLISGSSSSSQFPFLDETSGNKVEVFIFNIVNKEWSESVSGSIFIEKLRKPQTPLIIIKTESHPYNLIRKITQDFDLLAKDEKTWVFRASIKKKSSDYKESNIIACRFSTKDTAKEFYYLIKDVQSIEKTGFENLNFRLDVIRRVHEKEVEEKEAALLVNFPSWDDLLNGKYYQNFYSKGNSFHCSAEVREFDNDSKKWKELVLATLRIENFEDTGQTILTVIVNIDLVRIEITTDVELIAVDDRTWMWRGYKKCEGVKSVLIGCRFINSEVAKSFIKAVSQAQEYSPSRCAFRDEYISDIFKKECDIILADNQVALETHFLGECEITELDDGLDLQNACLPSTSKAIEVVPLSNKFSKTVSTVSLYSFESSSGKHFAAENSKTEILNEYKADFFSFDSCVKKWQKLGEGMIKIKREAEIPNLWISMKLEEEEKIILKISQDLELIEKDSRSLIWRDLKTKGTEPLLMSRFETSQFAEEFKNSMKNVQKMYFSELPSDELELEILKKLYETELEEKYSALGLDFPSHVELSWLTGSNIKWRTTDKEMSETNFNKGSLFYSKADLYKFDKNTKEWRKLTALPGFVSIKRKRFQEFQKTLIYAVTDEFQGRIVVKCEIGSNLNLEIKEKTSCVWRGFVEFDNGEIESFLIACRFSNSEIAKNFKTVTADVQQHSPWRCFLRDKFIIEILKKEKERIFEETETAVNSLIEENK